MSDGLTLEISRWYALTMYPGYTDGPYHSPIRIERVTPLGSGLIKLEYFNAGYAQGVELMQKKYRVHRRGEQHLVLDELQVPERTTIIEPLTAAWIATRAPWFIERMAEVRAA